MLSGTTSSKGRVPGSSSHAFSGRNRRPTKTRLASPLLAATVLNWGSQLALSVRLSTRQECPFPWWLLRKAHQNRCPRNGGNQRPKSGPVRAASQFSRRITRAERGSPHHRSMDRISEWFMQQQPPSKPALSVNGSSRRKEQPRLLALLLVVQTGRLRPGHRHARLRARSTPGTLPKSSRRYFALPLRGDRHRPGRSPRVTYEPLTVQLWAICGRAPTWPSRPNVSVISHSSRMRPPPRTG